MLVRARMGLRVLVFAALLLSLLPSALAGGCIRQRQRTTVAPCASSMLHQIHAGVTGQRCSHRQQPTLLWTALFRVQRQALPMAYVMNVTLKVGS